MPSSGGVEKRWRERGMARLSEFNILSVLSFERKGKGKGKGKDRNKDDWRGVATSPNSNSDGEKF